MKSQAVTLVALSILTLLIGCGARNTRGIADKRSAFEKFLPMERDVSAYGLKPVRPFFSRANRAEILRAIEHACQGSKEGSAIYDRRTGAGYYVNCNPRNRQLLNGYIPLDPRKKPHGRNS